MDPPDALALIRQRPAQAPAESRLAKYLMGFLSLGILVAAYVSYDPVTLAKFASRWGATRVSEVAEGDSARTSEIPSETTTKQDTAARTRLLAAAGVMMESILSVDTSERKVTYDQYAGAVAGLHTRIDEFLGMVNEAGPIESHDEVQQLCRLAATILQDHSQALDKWTREKSIDVERKEVRAAHEARIKLSTNLAVINESLQETTQKLDRLTGQSMAAIEARYDLWIDAQKQAKTASVVFTRWKQSVPPRE